MMEGTYYKEWSAVLDREMEFKVYGHGGVPVLALPARGGRFYDWENNGMPDAAARLLHEGKIQLFCADSIDGVFQEMYSKGGPIVSTYTATYGVPKIAFAMPMSRNLTLDGVTYTGIAVSYDTDVVDDLVDGRYVRRTERLLCGALERRHRAGV